MNTHHDCLTLPLSTSPQTIRQTYKKSSHLFCPLCDYFTRVSIMTTPLSSTSQVYAANGGNSSGVRQSRQIDESQIARRPMIYPSERRWGRSPAHALMPFTKFDEDSIPALLTAFPRSTDASHGRHYTFRALSRPFHSVLQQISI